MFTSGNSSKSSSSVVLVNDKDTDNQIGDSSDDVIGDDDDDDVGIDVVDDLINDDDDDDEFDLNEDISNEDVEKLVEAITANNVEVSFFSLSSLFGENPSDSRSL